VLFIAFAELFGFLQCLIWVFGWQMPLNVFNCVPSLSNSCEVDTIYFFSIDARNAKPAIVRYAWIIFSNLFPVCLK
jgi:hypothetical protein